MYNTRERSTASFQIIRFHLAVHLNICIFCTCCIVEAWQEEMAYIVKYNNLR